MLTTNRHDAMVRALVLEVGAAALDAAARREHPADIYAQTCMVMGYNPLPDPEPPVQQDDSPALLPPADVRP